MICKLDQIMRETKTSSEQLAKVCGVSKTTIQALRQNKPHHLLTLLGDICDYYGIDIEDLLEVNQEKERRNERYELD